MEQELLDWEKLAANAHFHGKNPWFHYHKFLTDATASIVGANTDEVVVMNSLTVNLHLMLVSFYRPTQNRFKIITENTPFRAMIYGLVAETTRNNPDNRARVLEIDPVFFAKVLRNWGDWAIAGGFHRANLSDTDLENIRTPAIVSPGDDPDHPEKVARELLNLLPNATWADATQRWSKAEMETLLSGGLLSNELFPFVPFCEEFIERMERN